MALALQKTSVSLFHAHGSNLSFKPTRFQRAAYFGRCTSLVIAAALWSTVTFVTLATALRQHLQAAQTGNANVVFGFPPRLLRPTFWPTIPVEANRLLCRVATGFGAEFLAAQVASVFAFNGHRCPSGDVQQFIQADAASRRGLIRALGRTRTSVACPPDPSLCA